MKTYLEILETLDKQDDKIMNEVIELVKQDPNFPNTNNIEVMAKYIYLKLNHKQTSAFQKSLMIYHFILNDFKQPEDPRILQQINFIVELQNNDKKYPFNS